MNIFSPMVVKLAEIESIHLLDSAFSIHGILCLLISIFLIASTIDPNFGFDHDNQHCGKKNSFGG